MFDKLGIFGQTDTPMTNLSDFLFSGHIIRPVTRCGQNGGVILSVQEQVPKPPLTEVAPSARLIACTLSLKLTMEINYF